MRETMNAMKPHCLAKALYDNIAETPEELAFRRGDVLTILEKDTNGLEGWWLCGLRGKQGIAPGNRLKPLMGMQESSIYDAPPSQKGKEETQQQTQWNRRSWDVLPDKIVTPHKIGEVYVYDQPNKGYQDYDVPPSRYFPSAAGQDGSQDSEGNYSVPNSISPEEPTYSIPPSRGNDSLYSTPSSLPTSKRLSPERDVYDRPTNQGVSPNAMLDVYDRPNPSSNRSSTISMLSTGSTNCSSEASSAQQSGSARSSTDISYHDLYDIPPHDPRGTMKKSNSEPLLDIYDSPPSKKQGEQLQMEYNDYDHPPPVEEGIYSTPPPPKAVKGNLNKANSILESERTSISVSKVKDLYDSSTLKKENSLEDIYATTPRNTPVKQHKLQSQSVHDPNHVYDVPPQVTKDTETTSNVTRLSRNSAECLDMQFARLSTGSDDSKGSGLDIGSVTYEELPLDLDAAMELLLRLQQDVHKATTRLLSFVSSTWRTKEKLEPRIYDVKLACMGVKTSLQEFLDFAQGALANSAKVSDKTLAKKLHTQLTPLQGAMVSISAAMKNLDTLQWQVAKLVSTEEASGDSLGQIVSSSKELSSDVRKLGSFIQGNSTLLFKRLGGEQGVMEPAERDDSGKFKQVGRPLPPVPFTGSKDMSPLSPPGKSPGPKPPLKPKPKVAGKPDMQGRPLPPPPPPSSTPPHRPHSQQDQSPLKAVAGLKAHKLPSQGSMDESGKFLEDYDYVHLESAEVREQRQQQEQFLEELAEEKKRDFTPKQKAQIQLLEKEVQREIDTDITKFKEERSTSQFETRLDPNDKQLLLFYAEQVMSHSSLLTNAIDAFLGGIEYNQPPKVFIAHSKFVVLGAHKLVYIGDTLHRNVMSTDIRNKIMHCANYLCDCLKATVTATKTAALQYPSLTAVQEMVDRVVDVSHAAHELKLVITQAAAL
ncbi:breast cancer anti-estrogen resistance protein 1-like isoform X1 [Lingula anatina]|uniref:Breast cancer anti-estrogen resistance protein 1 n=1 Tax=Lingula anatina TaxID=7574 RepID=A0A1S3J209_LINAN|nr:breast cancer anti-estrogen resistance protein 1-like isoform X1 [Lingula anatina]|eukprot:XP_013404460.1 breast cancer anti-estrogen resistance protein 1-like isoform X1 [Lingula anatina]